MFPAKVSMIIFSHLSDVQDIPTNKDNRGKINFVKFLINKYPNTDTEVEADNEWNEFISKHPNMVS